MPSTSSLGAAVAVEGLLLQVGNGSSPETFQTITNATDWAMPIMTDVVEVTNVGDSWKRRISTLHDMGKMSFKIYWQMEDPTQNNSSTGLRYLLINSVLRDYQAIYPNAGSSVDAWPAYVTEYGITGKVGGVFEASLTLANNGIPSLC
jgi:hypothetical protein